VNINDKFDTMQKDAAVAYFKVLTQNLPGGSEEKHEDFKP